MCRIDNFLTHQYSNNNSLHIFNWCYNLTITKDYLHNVIVYFISHILQLKDGDCKEIIRCLINVQNIVNVTQNQFTTKRNEISFVNLSYINQGIIDDGLEGGLAAVLRDFQRKTRANILLNLLHLLLPPPA